MDSKSPLSNSLYCLSQVIYTAVNPHANPLSAHTLAHKRKEITLKKKEKDACILKSQRVQQGLEYRTSKHDEVNPIGCHDQFMKLKIV